MRLVLAFEGSLPFMKMFINFCMRRSGEVTKDGGISHDLCWMRKAFARPGKYVNEQMAVNALTKFFLFLLLIYSYHRRKGNNGLFWGHRSKWKNDFDDNYAMNKANEDDQNGGKKKALQCSLSKRDLIFYIWDRSSYINYTNYRQSEVVVSDKSNT